MHGRLENLRHQKQGKVSELHENRVVTLLHPSTQVKGVEKGRA